MSLDKSALDQLRIDRHSSEPPKKRPWIFAGSGFLLIFLLAAGWFFFRPRTVEVRTVAARDLAGGSQRTVLNASGYVTARRQATISSKVTGKVVEVLIEEGMAVQAGQVLARLDASNVQASLNLAEARLAASSSALNEVKVRLAEAERNSRRTRELAKSSIASEVELDRTQAQVDSLKARLEQQEGEVHVAQQEVALWQQQLEDTIIRATFPGIVISKNAQPGEMISPISAGGGFTRTGICTIVDMQSLEIEVDVNESYIVRLKEGQPIIASLDAYPDWKIPARLIAIVPAADRQKATVRVRVGFNQLDPRILPDMGVKVAFQSEETPGVVPTGVLIPKKAVQDRGGSNVVLVVRDGRAEQRTVKPGETFDIDVVIPTGLKPGERVAVSGMEELHDGTRVTEKQP